MKRYIITFSLLVFSVFPVFSEDYKINVFSSEYSNEIKNDEIISLKEKESFIVVDSSCHLGINENNLSYLVTNNQRQLCIDGIYHKDFDNFEDALISCDSDQSVFLYLPDYFLEALFNNNFKKIDDYNAIHSQVPYSYYKYIADYLRHETGNFPIISNLLIAFMSGEQLLIKKIINIGDGKYNCDCIMSYFGVFDLENPIHTLFYPSLIDYYEVGDEIKIEVSIDGDYVFIRDIKRNVFIQKLFKADKNIIDECINLYEGKQVNIHNITWPRHADGTCDYEAK